MSFVTQPHQVTDPHIELIKPGPPRRTAAFVFNISHDMVTGIREPLYMPAAKIEANRVLVEVNVVS